MRRIPDPIGRLVVSDEAAHRLGGAVPSPAFAFLLALIALPSLFWLITLKRTTVYTAPEEWLMTTVVPAVHTWVQANLPPLELFLLAVSALGSGWFVALGFAVVGLLALGTLAFPMEWALKYFTSAEAIGLDQLVAAMFNINEVGLDDIADFPAGHALRATAFYGLAAFCVARLAPHRRQGLVAYGVALILIGAISATRVYLGAHYPIDVLGGWIAGGALVAILVAIHVLRVDERARARDAVASVPARGRRLSTPRGTSPRGASARERSREG